MVSVTSASRYITSASRYHPHYRRSSMYIRGLIPRKSAELAEAVPIGSLTVHCITTIPDDSLSNGINDLISSNIVNVLKEKSCLFH